MKMLKNILFILTLMLSGVVGCNATEPGSMPLDGLNNNSIDVGEIADEEIPDLKHSTCTLRLADNKKENFYNYVEGAICPVGGKECTYSAIMKLDGNLTILKQTSSNNNTSVFQGGNIVITTLQNPLKNTAMDEEGYDTKVAIILEKNNRQMKVEMSGYCGL